MKTLSCDLGGTRIKLGIVENSNILVQDVIPAFSENGLKIRLPEIKKTFQRLCSDIGLSISNCAGLAMGFPALVDNLNCKVIDEYGKYSDAPNMDLRKWCEAEMGLPLTLENDSRMAVIGEWQYGAGKGSDNMAMITLGTGIGTSAVINGEILRGKHGQAGCLGGHVSINPRGRLCFCGNLGCPEAEASTSRLNEILKDCKNDVKTSLVKEENLDYTVVFKHAAKGDKVAIEIRDYSLRVWGVTAVSLIHAYDPEIVIMGGGIVKFLGGEILPAIQSYINKYANTPWGAVNIKASQLEDNAAIIAGEWLLKEELTRRK